MTILWPYEGGITSDSFLFDNKLNQRGLGLPIRFVIWIRLYRLIFGEFAWGPAYAFTPSMHRYIAKYIKKNFSNQTVIVISHPWLGKSLKYLKDYNSLYFAHNVEAKIIRDSNLSNIRRRFLANRVEKLEKKVSSLSKKVAFVSEDDLQEVDWNLGGKEFQVIGVGSRPHEAKVRNHRKDLVFVGGDYLFNIEAAQEIIAIAKKMPELNFKIVGSVCNKLQTDLPNVSLLGWVSESALSAILEESAIFINPMKHGSGIHLKLVKAMSLGIPIISTPIGWRGFNKIGNLYCQIVSLEKFCETIRKTYEDYEKYQKLALDNQLIINESFSWETISRKFNEFVSGEMLEEGHLFIDPIDIVHENLKYENQITQHWRRIFNRLKKLVR